MYDDRFYDRGVSRNSNYDAASRVASEIFQHDLTHAAQDTRNLMRGACARDAEQFVQQVNQKLEQMNRQYGQDDDCSTNFLSARRSYDQYGRPTGDRISMVNTDGQSRGITEVPTQPYGRVPMNFNQYQDGEQPGRGYYDQQRAYNGYSQPPRYDDYNNGGYDQGYNQAAYYPPQNYGGYNPGYNPGYYVRPSYGYNYGAQYQYGGYRGGGSLATGLVLGAVASRLFHI